MKVILYSCLFALALLVVSLEASPYGHVHRGGRPGPAHGPVQGHAHGHGHAPVHGRSGLDGLERGGLPHLHGSPRGNGYMGHSFRSGHSYSPEHGLPRHGGHGHTRSAMGAGHNH